MSTRMALALSTVIVILLAVNWIVLQDLVDIGSIEPLPSSPVAGLESGVDRPLVRIGVISRFAPNVIYAGYQPIMDYLNRHGSNQYELMLSTSYQDAVERLRAGEVAASFLGAWIYGHLEAETELEPLVAPLNAAGRSEFHAVLVTEAESSIRTPADLRGKTVALPSPQSWSGNWLHTVGLSRFGLTPADLDSVHHFDHHQTVAWQVLRGRFDAGVVKESVAASFQSEGLRELARSGPIPGPPLAGSRRGPIEVLSEIRALLLALDSNDPADQAELATWSPEFAHGFTAVNRQLYLHAFGAGQEDGR